MKRIIVVLGTRPEAIKMAPLIKKFKSNSNYQVCVVSTGQHPDLLHQALKSFDLTVDQDLKLFTVGQSLSLFHSRAVMKLSEYYLEFKPDCVLYHGDTATAYAAAVAAFYLQIKHVHIEAGLRSNNLDSPFPEEFHRKMISQMSSYHFVPTEQEREHLMQDGISQKKISIVGNTISDSVFEVFNAVLPVAQDSGKKIIVLTLHRREKNREQLWGILNQLRILLDQHPEFEIRFPMHPNPVFTQAAQTVFRNHEKVRLMSALEYPEMLRLLSKANCVVTDSGGIQEECTLLGKKVFVVRDATERELPENAELISPDEPEKLYQRLKVHFLSALSIESKPGLRIVSGVSNRIVEVMEREVLCS